MTTMEVVNHDGFTFYSEDNSNALKCANLTIWRYMISVPDSVNKNL